MLSRRFLTASALLGIVACAGSDATGPVHGPSFSSGPPTALPNLYRTEGGLAGVITDVRTGLVLWGGLPHDPVSSVICGGSNPFNLHEIQRVGLKTGVVSALNKGGSTNLHVYDLATYQGLGDVCTDTPMATGTGSLTLHDNDIFVSGTRVNVIQATLRGVVDTGSGSAHVVGHITIQIDLDGDFQIVTSSVRLTQ